MRDDLIVDGKRHRYQGKVGGFGSTKGRYEKETLLLNDVIDLEQKKEVTDHLWFKKGKWSEGLKIGDVIEFNARPSIYKKGNWDSGFRYDSKLNNPSNVEVIEAAPIVEPDPVIEGKSKKKLPTLISPSGYVNGVKVR
jgi:hypothetical protein